MSRPILLLGIVLLLPFAPTAGAAGREPPDEAQGVLPVGAGSVRAAHGIDHHVVIGKSSAVGLNYTGEIEWEYYMGCAGVCRWQFSVYALPGQAAVPYAVEWAFGGTPRVRFDRAVQAGTSCESALCLAG